MTIFEKVMTNKYPYIIAEIGANHNGDIDLAKKIIDSAKSCGANAVKFQSWTPESLIAKEEYDRNQSYEDGDGGKKHFGSLKEMVEKYFLSGEQHLELKKYCDTVGIDFCSTPFSKEEAQMLEDLGVGFFKIASMDVNNYRLLKYVAKFKKPIVLSTGMASLSEIGKAIEIIESRGNHQIILLHCISIYPPKHDTVNLKNIPMLMEAFGYPVGFSDHSIGTSIPLASLALGSKVIEKHFTLDKDMPGWDHAISADPEELHEIINEGRNVIDSLGVSRRIVSIDEENKIKKFRRSAVLARAVKKNEVLTAEDLEFKRPGTGISPSEEEHIVGRTVNRDISKDTLLSWDDLN